MHSFYLFLTSSASTRSLSFLFFIVPMVGQNFPLIFPIFLKRSLVFPLLLFSSISLHYSLKKAFLSLSTILWNFEFSWVCLSLSLLFLLLIFLQLFVRPPQITTLPSWFSFSLWWFCSLPPLQYYWHLSLVLLAHYWSEEVKWSEVTQLCLTLCDPVDCSLPGSSIHGILQARILEWVAISFSRGSSRPRDQTWVSHIGGRCFNLWATTLLTRPNSLNLFVTSTAYS